MSDTPVSLQAEGPPETILPPEDEDVLAALAQALRGSDKKQAVAQVVARHPRFLAGWAALGDLTDDPIEAYAYYRIGYHRGLDKLRASGWRGRGYVRWRRPENRGFLESLAGLGRLAAQIGEDDEVERIEQFLKQLDPDWEGP